MKITGKHAIYNAALNDRRKTRIYHGKREDFIENFQNTPVKYLRFQESNQEFLEVQELYVESTIEEFLNQDRIILLDGLMDPRNLGAIIRSAAAFGFSVLLRRSKGCPITETVVLCSAGGIDQTNILSVTNIKTCLQTFKNKGFWIYGLHETGNISLKKINIENKKVMLVIGSESTGISDIIFKELDFVLKISTTDFSTLNASVAASTAMFSMFPE